VETGTCMYVVGALYVGKYTDAVHVKSIESDPLRLLAHFVR